MRKRPKKKKPQLEITANVTTADELLAQMEKLKIRFVKKPEEIGRDEHGLIAHWYLPGKTLTLRRTMREGVECYRVVEIQELEAS